MANGPIRLKVTEPNGANVRYLFQTKRGEWVLATAGGTPLAFSYLVPADKVMPLRFALEDAGSAVEAAAAVRKMLDPRMTVEVYG